MFSRLRARLTRMASTSSCSSSSPPEQQAHLALEPKSLRSLHWTKAVESLNDVYRGQAQQNQLSPPPQTPQHRRREQQCQGTKREATVIRAAVSSDGSSVELPSSQLLPTALGQRSSSDNEATSFNGLSNPFNLTSSRRASYSTVTTRRLQLEQDVEELSNAELSTMSQNATSDISCSLDTGEVIRHVR
jgi:hypothetical protein